MLIPLYEGGGQIKVCEDRGIAVHVAIPDKSKAVADQGRFTREAFRYDAGQGRYVCPAGKSLAPCGGPHEKNGKRLQRYQSKAADCNACPLRAQCLAGKSAVRQIQHWEHEAVAERHRERMAQNPGAMRRRAALAEHPFGTLKRRSDGARS